MQQRGAKIPDREVVKCAGSTAPTGNLPFRVTLVSDNLETFSAEGNGIYRGTACSPTSFESRRFNAKPSTNTKPNPYYQKNTYILGNSNLIPFLNLTQVLFNKIWINLTLKTEKPPNTKVPSRPRCCLHVQGTICFYHSPRHKQLQKLEENKPCWKRLPYMPLETFLVSWAQHPPARPKFTAEKPGAVSPVYLSPPSRLEIHSVSHTIHFYFSSMRADLAELLHHLHKTKILLWKAALKEKGFLCMSEKFTAWQNSEFNGLPVGKNSMHQFWSIVLSSHFLIYGWLRRHLS